MIDRNGNKRKFRSSTIFHLFMEGVLDRNQDTDLIDRIYREHIRNPEEFWTPYPFPSMAVNDPTCGGHVTANCWGYYTMGLIVDRGGLLSGVGQGVAVDGEGEVGVGHGFAQKNEVRGIIRKLHIGFRGLGLIC